MTNTDEKCAYIYELVIILGLTDNKDINMGKAVLFYLESPGIKISMEIYFNDKGQLYFDGYDIGNTVKEVWGDYDYEYTYTIESEEVNKFYKLLNLTTDDKSGLLQSLKELFSDNKAYTLFGNFMKANNIKYDSFSWV